jgi:hypothetical protein
MSADGQRKDRRWNMQHVGRYTETGQEMDHAAFRQMDRGRTGDGSYSMSADGQRQGRRWIMQHAGRWTGKAIRRWIMQHDGRCTEARQEMDRAVCRQMDRKGKQEMDHAACRQMYRGRTGDGSYSMPSDVQRQGRRWIIQHVGRLTEAGQEMDHTACRQMDRGRTGDGERGFDRRMGIGKGSREKDRKGILSTRKV